MAHCILLHYDHHHRIREEVIKLDLITGFLGSGKTTFIKQYAEHLISKGQRIAILENDYGAINVDMMLLKELEGKNCDLEMVVGGNDYDCHKRRFKSKLIALGMLGYDRVIIEPSGIYDVDEFFDVLHEDPIDRWYEIGSVLSVIDGNLEENLSDESNYLLVSQIADAGKIILSKTQLATEEEIQSTIDHLQRALTQFRCNRVLTREKDLLIRDWSALDDDDFASVMNAGVSYHDHIKLPVMDNNDFDSLFYMNAEITAEEIQESIRLLMADKTVGDILRIKGFLKNVSGQWFEVNATKQQFSLTPIQEGQEVIIVIGESLNRETVGSYWNYKYGTGKELL